jgi:hypothetical protein
LAIEIHPTQKLENLPWLPIAHLNERRPAILKKRIARRCCGLSGAIHPGKILSRSLLSALSPAFLHQLRQPLYALQSGCGNQKLRTRKREHADDIAAVNLKLGVNPVDWTAA